jgi:hypothetical protein
MPIYHSEDVVARSVLSATKQSPIKGGLLRQKAARNDILK